MTTQASTSATTTAPATTAPPPIGEPPGPLAGIRVLDVSTVYTAMLLGDYGARAKT